MPATRTVEVSGHIIDSLILAKVLDVIVDSGADYTLLDIHVGRRIRTRALGVCRVWRSNDGKEGADADRHARR